MNLPNAFAIRFRVVAETLRDQSGERGIPSSGTSIGSGSPPRSRETASSSCVPGEEGRSPFKPRLPSAADKVRVSSLPPEHAPQESARVQVGAAHAARRYPSSLRAIVKSATPWQPRRTDSPPKDRPFETAALALRSRQHMAVDLVDHFAIYGSVELTCKQPVGRHQPREVGQCEHMRT